MRFIWILLRRELTLAFGSGGGPALALAFYAAVTSGTGANQVWYAQTGGAATLAIGNLQAPAAALAVTAGDTALYVASGSHVKGYDIAGSRRSAPVEVMDIAVGPNTQDFAFDKSKRFLFVTCAGEGADNGAIYQIDLDGGRVAAKFSGPEIVRPQAIAGAR